MVLGAFKRTLFYGGFEYTCEETERTYNLQTAGMFIDLRIPRSRDKLLNAKAKSLDDYTPEELRIYSRQHIFAGCTVTSTSETVPSSDGGSGSATGMDASASSKFDAVCTRHHCIDWNYVGQGRNRPNKWWVAMNVNRSIWKEWAYATDPHGQHYYCEHWERLITLEDSTTDDDQSYTVLRLVEETTEEGTKDQEWTEIVDGVIIVCGDHFSYCISRRPSSALVQDHGYGSLVEIVDGSIERNDLGTAKRWLNSIEGGHGLVSNQWTIDCAIQPWKVGTTLWDPADLFYESAYSSAKCESGEPYSILWERRRWSVFDTTEPSMDSLRQRFTGANKEGNKKRKLES